MHQDRPDGAAALVPSSRFRAVARNRLLYSSLLCASSLLIFLGCIWLAHREVAGSIAVAAAGSIAFSIALARVTFMRRVPRGLLPASGAVLALAVYGTLLYSFLVIRSSGITSFVVLLMLAAGIMQSSVAWLLVTLVVAVGSWLVTGLVLLGASFVPEATGLVLASFISTFLHLFFTRHLAHLRQLHHRDRMHGEELAAALAAAHHELTERQRAEADRERLREQLLHSQKLEAIGTLAGGVAHDMNNMLAAILGAAELVREEPHTAPEAIEQITDVAQRGSELVRNLLGFSRRGQYRKGRIDPGAVVTSIHVLLSRTLPKEVEIVVSSSTTSGVEGDATQLGQALLNLCINASDAMEGRGLLRIHVDEVTLASERALALDVPEGRYITMTVADSGCGMDATVRSRMFEPFFTTKAPGRGTGLGLAMVYGTVTNHGGTIEVDSEPGRGTSITMLLPAVDRAGEAAALPAAGLRGGQQPPGSVARPVTQPLVAPDGATVLVIDDEAMVRSVTARSLKRAGYHVLTAGDGAEGLALFEKRAADIGLVVLDMAMPVMGGAECFHRMRAVDSRVRVLLASGYALEEEARACLAAGALGFLEKPFSTADLLEAVSLARAGRRVEGRVTATGC